MKRLVGAVLLSLACAIAGVLVAARPSRAHNHWIHVVRPGETLASIAQRYYGKPRLESVLVAENGLTAQGGGPIVSGLRLVIPSVSYHRVQGGETWSALADRFYGDTRRAFILVEANRGSARQQPAEGAEVIVPYPLRYVAGQGETIQRVAKVYYGSGNEHVGTLRRFNNFRGTRLSRGQTILVPLADLVLSEEGRRIVGGGAGSSLGSGEVRELQSRIDGQLPILHEHGRRGRFTEAVALANQLLGAGELTGNQIVTIQRELANAYVALGRGDLAVEAFRAALSRQPDLELDTMRTSPIVLAAFREAQGAQRGAAGTPDGGVADAGVDGSTAR